MSEPIKEEVVLTLVAKKIRLVELKAEVFDIMGVWEDLQGQLQKIQKRKMTVITEINKLKVAIKKEEEPEEVNPETPVE